MSLSVALTVARAGLTQAERKIAVVSSNINNADVAGYTRKAYQSSMVTANGITIPSGGVAVQAHVNAALTKSMVAQGTLASKSSTLASYLSDYSASYGSTGSDATTLATALSSLTTALQNLEDNAGDATSASQIISSAMLVASQLNALSSSLQNQREEASDGIAASVGIINTQLQTIADLNGQITRATAMGVSSADLEDQRLVALQTLSQEMGVQYTVNAQNQMQVYSSGGDILVGSHPATLGYSSPGHIGNGTTYPGGIPAITLNGQDITGRIGTGNLGALIQLRDTTLPAEQAKLDELASTLAQVVNTALANGTAVPAPSTLSGTTPVDASTPLNGTGTWRIALTDSSGAVQSLTDLDLSVYATVDELVAALNGIAGVSASIDSSGKLVLTSNDSSRGVALHSMDGTVNGQSVNAAFGFNALFVGARADTINVNPVLRADPGKLATATISGSADLAVGARAFSSGDVSTLTALIEALGSKQSFDAAGNFNSRNSTIADYVSAVIADAAMQASTAKTLAETATASHTYLAEKLANETGVNLDEESANMVQIQASYEANAQLIATIRDLFSTLLRAVQ